MLTLGITGSVTRRDYTLPSLQSSLVNALLPGVTSASAPNMPRFTSEGNAGVPAIGAISDMTQPGETLSLYGDGLADAEFLMWCGGRLSWIEPIRQWSDAAQITIPVSGFDEATQSVQSLTNSVVLVWPKNSAGFGRPIRINTPEIYRTWPAYHYVGRSRTLQLIGKNLAVTGAAPRVVAKRGSDAAVDLDVVSETKYEVNVLLPSGFAAGTWTIQLYNGTGGEVAWSNQITLTVAAALATSATEFNVTSQAGATLDAKFAAALAAASAVPGSTVFFPAGTHELTGTTGPGILSNTQGISVPSWTDNAPLVHIRGAGEGVTIIKKSASNTNVYGLWLYMTAEGSTASDITLDDVGLYFCSRGQIATRVTFDEWDAIEIYPYFPGPEPVSFDKVMNLDVETCAFNGHGGGPCVNLGRGSDIRFAGCTFVGHYIDGQKNKLGVTTGANHQNNGISTYGTRRLLIENNSFTSFDAESGVILTRAFTANWSADAGHYVKNNSSIACGAFAAIDADGNTGENWLLHGGVNAGITATVTASTETTTTVSFNAAAFAAKSWDMDTTSTADLITTKTLSVIVRSGKAKAQYKNISSYTAVDANTLRFTHEPYVNLQPSAGDSVAIRPAFRQMIFANNIIDFEPSTGFTDYSFNRVGIYCFDTSLGLIIDGNSVSNAQYGVAFNCGSGDAWVQAGAHVVNNTVSTLHRWFPAAFTAGVAEVSSGYVAGNSLWSMLTTIRGNTIDTCDTGVWVGSEATGMTTSILNGHSMGIYEANVLSNIVFSPSTADHSFYMTRGVSRALMLGNQVEAEPALQELDVTRNHELHYVEA